MTIDDVVTRIFSSAAFLAVLVTLYAARNNRKAGVKGDEREARKIEAEQRRDTVADRDSMIDQLQEDVRDIRVRLTSVEGKLDETTDLLYDERDYNRILIDFIYKGGTPPPPDRPTPRRRLNH